MTINEIFDDNLTKLGFKQIDKEINNGRQFISQDGEETLTVIYSSPIRFTLEFPLNKKPDGEADLREKACIVYDGNIASYYSPKTRKKIEDYNRGLIDTKPEADMFDRLDSMDSLFCLDDVRTWAKEIQKDNGYRKDERAK